MNPNLNVKQALEETESFLDVNDLFEPLKVMYDSLVATGDESTANNMLLDMLRQVGERGRGVLGTVFVGGGGEGLGVGAVGGQNMWVLPTTCCWTCCDRQGGGGGERGSGDGFCRLKVMYDSLVTTGDESTANNMLLDMLRQVRGVCLFGGGDGREKKGETGGQGLRGEGRGGQGL